MKLALILFVIMTTKLYGAFDHSHSLWGNVLNKYVEEKGPTSFIRYSALRKRQQDLNKYTTALQLVTKEEFQGFSLDEKTAFLLNAYNALALDLVLKNAKIKSINELGSILSSPWKKKFFTLLGEKESLNEVENLIYDSANQDPRLIFALARPCRSCPALRREPYMGARLNQQLEEATQLFLLDKSRNHYDTKNHVLYLSELLKKHKGILEKRYGSLQAFVAPRIATSPEEQKLIESNETKIVFQDMNWDLNEAKH